MPVCARIDSKPLFEALHRHEERWRAADIRAEHVHEGQAGHQRRAALGLHVAQRHSARFASQYVEIYSSYRNSSTELSRLMEYLVTCWRTRRTPARSSHVLRREHVARAQPDCALSLPRHAGQPALQIQPRVSHFMPIS